MSIVFVCGSYWLARATRNLAEAGGIPPEEIQKAGEEAIALARKALEIDTQLHGIESVKVAHDMRGLADVLDIFNDVDDDEILRLHEKANAIFRREEGSSSFNVAVGELNLSNAFWRRANRAQAANDMDRRIANLELAQPHYREAARIYRVVNHIDNADEAKLNAIETEENIRQIGIA